MTKGRKFELAYLARSKALYGCWGSYRDDWRPTGDESYLTWAWWRTVAADTAFCVSHRSTYPRTRHVSVTRPCTSNV